MNKYTLLQAPVEDSERSSQIIFIDESTEFDQKKAEKLLSAGWKCVGTVESEHGADYLRSGFEFKFECRAKLIRKAVGRIQAYLEAILRATWGATESIEESIRQELMGE